MKDKMMMCVMTAMLMIFSGCVMANDNILNNTQWKVADNNRLAMTMFAGNPYQGKEGIVMAMSCAKKGDGYSDNVIYTIADKGGLKSSIANAFNRMVSDSDALNNERFGLGFSFSDGSSYVFQLVKADENFVKGATLSTVAANVSPEVTEKMKKTRWVDVKLLIDGQNMKIFKPFSLDNSMKSLNSIESCYNKI